MSENKMIMNQTDEDIYLSVYNSGGSEPAYKTYIPPGGAWSTPSEVTTVMIIDKADYDSESDSDSDPESIPIFPWVGEYDTETHYYDATFSPLVISEDGTVTVAGQQLVVSFDEDTSVLSWDWQQIGDHTTKASITFEEPDGLKSFDGTINPSQEEGILWYKGTIT